MSSQLELRERRRRGGESGVARARRGVRGGGKGVDIIDLDRFMRRSVRPSHTRTHYIDPRPLHAYRTRLCTRPVGYTEAAEVRIAPASVGREGLRGGGGDSSTAHTLTSQTSDYRKLRYKRFLLDVRPRHHRSLSNESLMTFRVNCERTLRNQQHQLEHITTLCEQLVAQPRSSRPSPRRRPPPRTTDSSTSRSTQCNNSVMEPRTYKIIMSKLDQLNQLFKARKEASTGVGSGRRRGMVRRIEYNTSASVSVSNKLVATDLIQTHIHPLQHSEERGVGSQNVRATPSVSAQSIKQFNNIQRTVSSEEKKLMSGCAYDLEDPMHLYMQAKRILELDAQDMGDKAKKSEVKTTAGSGSAAGAAGGKGAPLPGAAGSALGAGGAGAGGDWLCAWCRTQWRAFRHCLSQLGVGTT